MKKLFTLGLIAVLAATLLTACSGGAGGGKTVPLTLTMGENNQMKFNPATITVDKGSTVQLTLVNKDTAQAHDFTVPDFNVMSPNVGPGQSATIKFTANKAGTFTFFCSVPGHRENGMQGTITVK
ncbi:MAG: cupredoxin domain-containing protein [Mycobacterium leprae]